MKIGWLLFLLLILTKPMQNASLNEIRTLYAMAPNNRIASEKLSTLCLSIDSIASPVLVCYKGASTMIEAKYQINPLNKLAKFNEGLAIDLEPLCIITNRSAHMGYVPTFVSRSR